MLYGDCLILWGKCEPSISMEKWVTGFRCGRTSNAEHSKRQIDFALTKTIERNHDTMLADRRLKVNGILGSTGI